jgi:magnesium-protoporphyrin IX monomethyl ester (oxidative) cyclase
VIKIKVLLVKPHFRDVYTEFKSVATEYPPLGLMYLASYLEKNGHKVKIADMSAEKMSDSNLIEVSKKFQPDVVGFTVTTPLSNRSHQLAALIKNALKNVFIVFGGPHPTALPEEELKDKNVDFVIRSEGEISFCSLVDNKCENVDNILGLSYKKNGKVVNNPNQPYINNLDELPFPAYHLIDIKKYFFVDARKYPLAPLITSRGCPFGCTYCNKNISGKLFRARSAKNVVDEIEFLISNYDVKEIHILDDAMTTISSRMIDLCDEIKRRGINVLFDAANGIRADCVTPELLKRMKDVGFYKVAFGIESGDETIRNNIKKNLKTEKIKRAVVWSKKIGLEVWGFFIIGLPGETKKTVEKTVKLAIDLDLDVAKFYVMTPMPGTELFEIWKKEGYIKTFDWSEYSFYKKPVYELPNLTADEILELHKYCFKKFYLRPKFFFKKIRKISSLKHLMLTSRTGIDILGRSIK